jgi:L-malate glycosyltransferase
MEANTPNKLLLIGSTDNPVHIRNFYFLIKDLFDEVLIVGTKEVDFCSSKALDFQVKNVFRMLRNVRKLKDIITAFNPSIIHVHQANSFGYITSMANKRKFPQVLTVWGSDVLILPQKSFLYRTLAKVSLRHSLYITADAQIMADAIHKLTGRQDVILANFGIDINTEEANRIAKEKLIYSNRMHDSLYNVDQIILGTAQFLTENPTWKLVIAATGSDTERLKALAAAKLPSNQYEFVGFVQQSENYEFYQKARLYISIPESDGTAVSLLEAMTFGCVPIVSDLAANREWINSGVNGIICTSTDLHTHILEGIQLDQPTVAAINLAIIRKKGTKEANRKLFLDIYQKLGLDAKM